MIRADLYNTTKKVILKTLAVTVAFFVLLFYVTTTTHAQTSGTLFVSPATGVYTANSVFTVRVSANTGGALVNASEGILTFNPSELRVVGVSDAGSIFNLWVTEPEFNNNAGTISFAGGSPKGYKGSSGTIFSVTFKAVKQSASTVRFTSGVMTAADGKGTNIIGTMSGGTYTISSQTTVPEPEYVAPNNSPKAPNVTSSTHPDGTKWYTANDVSFSWSIPSGVTNVRLSADDKSSTIPTVFYETPIKEKVLEDFDEGAWYLHVQFKNSDGWGKVTHFPFKVDNSKPESLTIKQVIDTEGDDPRIGFEFIAVDTVSGVKDYEIQFDGGDIIRWKDDGSHIYTPELQSPGEHVMVVRALDGAGNAIVESLTFTVASLDIPVITDYPESLNSGNVLVIRGVALPKSTVTIYIEEKGSDPEMFDVIAGEDGKFTFIMDEKPKDGIYKLWATATDKFGATSDPSEKVTFIVQESGLLKIGSLAISWLSILIPLFALVILLVLFLLYIVRKIIAFKRNIRKEVTEAEEVLHRAITNLHFEVSEHMNKIESARKRRALTKEEERMVAGLNAKLDEAEQLVSKEIKDIRKVK